MHFALTFWFLVILGSQSCKCHASSACVPCAKSWPKLNWIFQIQHKISIISSENFCHGLNIEIESFYQKMFLEISCQNIWIVVQSYSVFCYLHKYWLTWNISHEVMQYNVVLILFFICDFITGHPRMNILICWTKSKYFTKYSYIDVFLFLFCAH